MDKGLSQCFLALVAVLLLYRVKAIPLAEFYPFGNALGDKGLFRNDDGSSLVLNLTTSFPFFNRDHLTLFVNNNGIISFTVAIPTYTPDPFPLAGDLELIAPFWGDVDTRGVGTVWFRETASGDLLDRALEEIRAAFVVPQSFRPCYLIIATWDHVGYFDSNSDKTNTFQCIMATDGFTSFVLYYYADGEIQWTTGDASGGINGLGGTPARVGFNAGDGVRSATVPVEVITIANTSNVDIPGVWIFQVDESIKPAGCGVDVPFTIAPRYGNVLGGEVIKVAGPCLDAGSDISCTFDGIETRGIFLTKLQAICISPLLSRTGRVPVQLMIDGVSVGETVFTSLSVARGHDVDVLSADDNLVFSVGSEIEVIWDPDTIFSVLPSDSYTVDLFLYHMDLSTGNWREFSSLASNVENNGALNVTVENIPSGDNVLPIAIFVFASSEGFPLPQLTTLDLRAGKWSAQFYYGQSFALQIRGRFLCEAWYLQEPPSIGSELLERVTPCPPTEEQARLPNSRIEEESHFSFLGNTRYHSQQMNYFNPGVSVCYRQRIIDSNSTDGSGQQCCYDERGNLVVGAPGGGSVDQVSTDVSESQHFVADVLPFVLCCKTAFPDCAKYYERRPSDDGSRFNPPPPAWMFGDPHMVTLDGLKYTFNGKGEFTLIETTNNSFSLQGRMTAASDPSGNPVSATVFSALVAEQSNSDVVQFELSDRTERGVDVLINGERVALEAIPEQEYQNVVVADRGNHRFAAVFSSGVYIEVQEENGILSTLIVSLPSNFLGMTSGLLGSYNGDTADDLLPRLADNPIPVDSTIQEIHETFATTWIVGSSNDSLFHYGDGESWETFHEPTFTPVYQPAFSDPAQAAAVCGNDSFCLFDVAATGRVDIGLSTLSGSQNVELVIQLSLPIVCDPPCEQGACIGNDTCNCAAGFSGDRCNETVITECAVNFCENGECQNRAGSFFCICPPEYTGVLCESSSRSSVVCDPPCEQGTCIGNNTCNCMAGFSGNCTVLCTGLSTASIIAIAVVLGVVALLVLAIAGLCVARVCWKNRLKENAQGVTNTMCNGKYSKKDIELDSKPVSQQ